MAPPKPSLNIASPEGRALGGSTEKPNGGPPALPRRSTAGTVVREEGRGPVDLLDALDESGSDMGGWETLQPNTKRLR